VEGTLVKVIDLHDAKGPPKGKFKVVPALSFEILERFLREPVDVGRVFISFNRSVIRDVDNNPCSGFANPVHFFKKLNEVADMLEKMAAEDFIDGALQKRQLPLHIANEIHSRSPLPVNAQVSRSLDSAGPEIDLYRLSFHDTKS
jgi:hypothetical protein